MRKFDFLKEHGFGVVYGAEEVLKLIEQRKNNMTKFSEIDDRIIVPVNKPEAETDALVKDLVVVNPDEITIVPGDDTIVYLQLPKDVEGETLPAEAALPKEGISA